MQGVYLRTAKKLPKRWRTPPDQLHEGQIREYLPFLKNDCGFAPHSMRVAVYCKDQAR